MAQIGIDQAPVPMAAVAVYFAAVLLGIFRLVSFAESPSSLSSIAVMPREKREATVNSNIHIVFSDVDGTLVHYPKNVDDDMGDPGNAIIKLPASSTGMQGIISSETLRKCQALRRRGKKLVLISGMRSTTMWKRLPYLPRADAYCCEAGGRIFYPVPPRNNSSVFKLEPFDGADKSELEAFSLEEDKDWRVRMELTAGVDGFVGKELDDDSSATPIPIDQRKSPLWEYCSQLQRKGFVVDTTGYSVCFRVNRKQQDVVSQIEFEALSSIPSPEGIATSVNLGCVDFYPHDSGKKNWYVISSFNSVHYLMPILFPYNMIAVITSLESCARTKLSCARMLFVCAMMTMISKWR